MRLRWAFLLCIAAILASCGGAPSGATADQVKTALTGLGATDWNAETIEAGAPVPHSFKEHYAFSIPSVAPKGGQVFLCDTKKNCDAIYAYFDALKALAGPYLYQSKSGTVVAQLNSGLTPDEAAKYEAAITALP